MNVLSLFDGIACGRLALQRAGIKVDNYYASEIELQQIFSKAFLTMYSRIGIVFASFIPQNVKGFKHCLMIILLAFQTVKDIKQLVMDGRLILSHGFLTFYLKENKMDEYDDDEVAVDAYDQGWLDAHSKKDFNNPYPEDSRAGVAYAEGYYDGYE